MSRGDRPSRSPPRTEYGWSFEETAHRQRLAGLAMTPLERLRWLDRRKKELQDLLGRAASRGRED